MFDSRVLETGIGIAFLFLGVSLAVTAIQEFIASALKLRASALAIGLKAMLTEGEQGLDVYRKIMAHPAVTPAGDRPSYISAQQFSTAALNLLGGASRIPSAVMSLRIAAQNLPDSPFKQIVTGAFREGEDELSAVQNRLETWFDQSMDRVSGIYKRWSQWISLGLGAVVAFLFQINAFAAVALLWSSPSVTASLMNRASAAVHPGTNNSGDVVVALNPFVTPLWEQWPSAHMLSWFLGCATTAIAISLGAPFWFDALQNLMNLRGTGAPPKSSVANK